MELMLCDKGQDKTATGTLTAVTLPLYVGLSVVSPLYHRLAPLNTATCIRVSAAALSTPPLLPSSPAPHPNQAGPIDTRVYLIGCFYDYINSMASF